MSDYGYNYEWFWKTKHRFCLLFVRLVYEEKIHFKKKLFHNVSFGRASCEEQSESIENHYNLQFVYYQILNEQ